MPKIERHTVAHPGDEPPPRRGWNDGRSACSSSIGADGLMTPETLYEGPANNATFYLPAAGEVWFGFSDPSASGYVRSPDGSLARVQPGVRLFLSAGQHVLTLYDPKLVARVSIVFMSQWAAMRTEITLGRVVERNSVPEVQEPYKIPHGPWSACFCPGVRGSGPPTASRVYGLPTRPDDAPTTAPPSSPLATRPFMRALAVTAGRRMSIFAPSFAGSRCARGELARRSGLPGTPPLLGRWSRTRRMSGSRSGSSRYAAWSWPWSCTKGTSPGWDVPFPCRLLPGLRGEHV